MQEGRCDGRNGIADSELKSSRDFVAYLEGMGAIVVFMLQCFVLSFSSFVAKY